MSDCHIEETDLPGYWVCTEPRVEMSRRGEVCALWTALNDCEYLANLANERRDQLADLRHRNAVLTESLAAHADEITALRAEIAALVERLLGAP
jgi:hypothetical protein